MWVGAFEMPTGRGVLHQTPSHLNPFDASFFEQCSAFLIQPVWMIERVGSFPVTPLCIAIRSTEHCNGINSFPIPHKSRQQIQLLRLSQVGSPYFLRAAYRFRDVCQINAASAFIQLPASIESSKQVGIYNDCIAGR
jgi:hypothetical protein